LALLHYLLSISQSDRVLVHNRLHRLLNRNLPDHVTIDLLVAWPLWLLPLFLIGQILTPHPVWMIFLIVVIGVYAFGYWWVRSLADGVTLTRERQGALLVAGDLLEEEFTLHNPTRFSLLWAEFLDQSDLPGYDPSLVVSVGSSNKYRWRAAVECLQRGVFRLGPSRIITDDLFGIFQATLDYPHVQQVLIYPRVLQLPEIELPRGQAGADERRRRPLLGPVPAPSVRDYYPGASMREIHWRSTARLSRLMVRETEIEPTGDVWIILDLNRAAHSGSGETSTLEYAIVLAASLAATLLDHSGRRAVGLVAVSGEDGLETDADGLPNSEVDDAPHDQANALWVPPQPGQAQLWRLLAALAPAQPTTIPLADLLRRSGPGLGHRRTVIVITADLAQDDDPAASSPAGAWPAELMRLQAAGLASSVLLVSAPGAEEEAAARRRMLAQVNVPSQLLPVDAQLPPLITYRRTRTVVRSTPTGGVVTYEVEEEVG
jgi:uncharacterized protein (DUF58 family)